MKRTLQRKYDSILPAGWRPPLYSRRDLLTWSCNQYLESLKQREDVTERDYPQCENYGLLLTQYGPDYDRIRGKVGHIRGLFDQC